MQSLGEASLETFVKRQSNPGRVGVRGPRALCTHRRAPDHCLRLGAPLFKH